MRRCLFPVGFVCVERGAGLALHPDEKPWVQGLTGRHEAPGVGAGLERHTRGPGAMSTRAPISIVNDSAARPHFADRRAHGGSRLLQRVCQSSSRRRRFAIRWRHEPNELARPALAGRWGALVLSLVTAGPALAEGAWGSYAGGIRPGYESREWVDNNSDGASTGVKLRLCEYTGGSGGYGPLKTVKIRILRHIPILPDNAWAPTPYYCNTSTWQEKYIGRAKPGTYRFSVTYVDGTQRPVYPIDIGRSTQHGITVVY